MSTTQDDILEQMLKRKQLQDALMTNKGNSTEANNMLFGMIPTLKLPEQQRGPAPMPEVPDMRVAMPSANQLMNQSMANAEASRSQSGGLFKGILGNLASSYISNKFSKYQDKQDAEDIVTAYSPVVKAQTESEENPILKKQYGVFQSMIDSKHPALVAKGIAGIMDIQKAQETAALREEPALIREVSAMYPYLKPGTPEYAQKVMEFKKAGSMNIFTGDNTQMQPATKEQKIAWGYDPNVPATINIKTGELIQHPIAVTEDQGKTGMLVGSLTNARKGIEQSLRGANLDISKNPSDWGADILSKVPLDIAKDVGTTLKSASKQVYDAHASAAKIAIIHLLSGQGFSYAEAEEKANAAIPSWGSKDEAVQTKLKYMDDLISSATVRAGPGLPGKYSQNQENAGAAGPSPASKPLKEPFVAKVATGVKLPKGQNIGDTFDMPDGIKTIFRGNINGQPKYEPLNNESFINGKPRLSQEEAYRMAKERGLIK